MVVSWLTDMFWIGSSTGTWVFRPWDLCHIHKYVCMYMYIYIYHIAINHYIYSYYHCDVSCDISWSSCRNHDLRTRTEYDPVRKTMIWLKYIHCFTQGQEMIWYMRTYIHISAIIGETLIPCNQNCALIRSTSF